MGLANPGSWGLPHHCHAFLEDASWKGLILSIRHPIFISNRCMPGFGLRNHFSCIHSCSIIHIWCVHVCKNRQPVCVKLTKLFLFGIKRMITYFCNNDGIRYAVRSTSNFQPLLNTWGRLWNAQAQWISALISQHHIFQAHLILKAGYIAWNSSGLFGRNDNVMTMWGSDILAEALLTILVHLETL